MDPQVQASFIPKKSLDVSASRAGNSTGLLFLLALLVFVLSIVAAAGSFLYTQYLNTSMTSKAKSLALAEGAYDPGVIENLVRIDARLTQSKALLNKHIAVTGLFNFLSSQTLEHVSFSNFDYILDADGTAKVSMTGVADSFATVALQSDQFGGNKLLKNVVFTNITLDATGKVGFLVTANLDPSILSYTNSLGTSASTAGAGTLPTTIQTTGATSTSQGIQPATLPTGTTQAPQTGTTPAPKTSGAGTTPIPSAFPAAQ